MSRDLKHVKIIEFNNLCKKYMLLLYLIFNILMRKFEWKDFLYYLQNGLSGIERYKCRTMSGRTYSLVKFFFFNSA